MGRVNEQATGAASNNSELIWDYGNNTSVLSSECFR